MRLSIEITREQHKKLKATAAMQGKSIRDYVLDRTLPGHEVEAAPKELKRSSSPEWRKSCGENAPVKRWMKSSPGR